VFRGLGRGVAAGVLAVWDWSTGAPAWAGTLEGTATYRERIALPPDAVFEAVLDDVSRADAAATVLGRATIDPAGQPPFRFAIPYDDAAVQPGRRYAARAAVRHRGRLLFATDRAYPVLGGGAAPLEMLLVSTGGRQPSPKAGAGARGMDVPASYEGEVAAATGGSALWHLDLLPQGRFQLRITQTDKAEPNRVDDIGRWRREPSTGRLLLRGGREISLAFVPSDGGRTLRAVNPPGQASGSGQGGRLARLPQPALIEPRLALTGMFVYLADAAAITLCADGGRLPVVMEADYRALEAAYLKARREPGQALLVSLDGLIAPRPSMEASQPPRRSLVVERFVGVWPRESCGNPLVDSPLRGTHWKLVRLGEVGVEAVEPQREPYLVFARDERRVSGSGGCNRVTGGFELDGEKLKLGPMAGTMMACPTGMEQEQPFLQSIGNVERYRIRNSHLDMLDASGTAIARFEAAPPR
jgi:copper homeostasis protein (lipoprotein)